MYKMCSKLTEKTSERCHCFVFLVGFKRNQHITQATNACSAINDIVFSILF